jgi:hypothetical protein
VGRLACTYGLPWWQRLAPPLTGGVGYVTTFDVRKDYLDRFPVQQAGGRDVLEYWIPAEELGELNANITGAIRQEARYLGPVPDEEFAQAAVGLGRQFPDEWSAYLQGQSWLSRGWLDSGCYLTLLAPEESFEWQNAWQEAARLHPGILLIGTDGSNELIAVDTRDPLMPVVHLATASGGWDHATPQGYGIAEFIVQVEAGTFEFTWLQTLLRTRYTHCLIATRTSPNTLPPGCSCGSISHSIRCLLSGRSRVRVAFGAHLRSRRSALSPAPMQEARERHDAGSASAGQNPHKQPRPGVRDPRHGRSRPAPAPTSSRPGPGAPLPGAAVSGGPASTRTPSVGCASGSSSW